MAAYFAQSIKDGRDYNSIFKVSVYKRYQDATDAILELEGFVDLIPTTRKIKNHN